MQPLYDDPNPDPLSESSADSEPSGEAESLLYADSERSRSSTPNRRLIPALLAYAALAVLAGIRLDGRPRLVVWIFLGLFTVKTFLMVLKRETD